MSPPNNVTVFNVTSEPSNGRNDSNRNDEQYEQQPQHQRKQQLDWEGPPAQGLYDPVNEHEACGVGFIVAIDGKRSHKVNGLLFIHSFIHYGALSHISIMTTSGAVHFFHHINIIHKI